MFSDNFALAESSTPLSVVLVTGADGVVSDAASNCRAQTMGQFATIFRTLDFDL